MFGIQNFVKKNRRANQGFRDMDTCENMHVWTENVVPKAHHKKKIIEDLKNNFGQISQKIFNSSLAWNILQTHWRQTLITITI